MLSDSSPLFTTCLVLVSYYIFVNTKQTRRKPGRAYRDIYFKPARKRDFQLWDNYLSRSIKTGLEYLPKSYVYFVLF